MTTPFLLPDDGDDDPASIAILAYMEGLKAGRKHHKSAPIPRQNEHLDFGRSPAQRRRARRPLLRHMALCVTCEQFIPLCANGYLHCPRCRWEEADLTHAQTRQLAAFLWSAAPVPPWLGTVAPDRLRWFHNANFRPVLLPPVPVVVGAGETDVTWGDAATDVDWGAS